MGGSGKLGVGMGVATKWHNLNAYGISRINTGVVVRESHRAAARFGKHKAFVLRQIDCGIHWSSMSGGRTK